MDTVELAEIAVDSVNRCAARVGCWHAAHGLYGPCMRKKTIYIPFGIGILASTFWIARTKARRAADV